MKERSFMSYIFTGFEILYLAKCMGAEKIIDMDFEEFKKQGNIMEKAEKSLEYKNYVFKDFNGELIFNKELVKYFDPIVNGKWYAACAIKSSDYSKNLAFYIHSDSFVCIEKDNFNKDNYVLTYGRKIESIANDLLREANCFSNEKKSDGTLSFAFRSLKNEYENPRYLVYRFFDGKAFCMNEREEFKPITREEMKNAIKSEMEEIKHI